MKSSDKLDLTGIKTIFVVTLLAVPVICYIGLLGYGQVDVDVTAHLRRFKVAWNSAFDWQGKNSTIHLAVVLCGSRLEEGLVMIKSAVIFSQTYLVLHVFAEDGLRQGVKEEFESWPYSQKIRLKLLLHKIQFPDIPGCKTCTPKAWVKLFRQCAAQRLFIPEILTDVDSLLYMDTDTVFLSPIEEVWEQYANFGPKHIFGIVPELAGWYASHKSVPHCTKTGVNSGVMLMNLTRVREEKWLFKIQEYFENYKELLELGDQDLINIYCFFNPGVFYMMQCVWNYRGGFCYLDEFCKDAINTGINILHANNRIFHDDKVPILGQIYSAFKEYDLSKHSPEDLYNSIVDKIKPYAETKCGKRQKVFTKNLLKYIRNYKVAKSKH